MTRLKTLLIDNYDSFTYNLLQLLGEVDGELPEVVRNDEASWEELARGGFDNVVISPGPGRPDEPADFGVCADAIRHADVPLLGVCLGHQGIATAFGGRVVHAREPFHGRLSTVAHAGGPLFAGIPARFEAVRYHSLCVDPRLPDVLEPLAWTDDGVLMALAHRSRPLWGVQFHPESIATEHGRRLLANFRDLTAAHRRPRARGVRPGEDGAATGARSAAEGSGGAAGADAAQPGAAAASGEAGAPRLLVERIDARVDPEAAFEALYGAGANAFWLDSARPAADARFSYMGDAQGPLAAVVTYRASDGPGLLTIARSDGTVERRRESIFDYLEREQARLGGAEPPELPFDLRGGLVGYLGYELKAEAGAAAPHRSPLPDAAFVRADRIVAFDHREGVAYLLCLVDAEHAAAGRDWIAATASKLAGIARAGGEQRRPAAENGNGADAAFGAGEPRAGAVAGPFELARSRERYLDDIAVCQERLRDGDSYEVCLTNRIEARFDGDPLELYRRLRRVNPAPFAAYLRFGDVAVLSSSPERFLRVGRDGWAEAKPIKGTAPRGATPAEDARLAAELRASEKDRAENLMIADLLRNDFGRVCEVGSVTVPRLMDVESYATVHQLVSTVRGRLRPGVGAPACVRACFPPGSMTGAPKLRTMEILDALEREPRGVYSGAIGWFGAGGGCDLSVTIRTIVLAGGRATIGVGGAIVAQSDPEEELAEALLKGEAPLRALGSHARARPLDSAACPPAIPRP